MLSSVRLGRQSGHLLTPPVLIRWPFVLLFSTMGTLGLVCSHHTAGLKEPCLGIYLFELAFPQLTTFLSISQGKRLWRLSCLVTWSRLPFPILLLKSALGDSDSSCPGKECFPVGGGPLPVTAISCRTMRFSPNLGFRGFSRFQLKTSSSRRGWKTRSCLG